MRRRFGLGEKHHNAILTADDVRVIRAAAEERKRLREEANKLSNVNLGEKFGVHPKTIASIINRENWAHV